MKLIRSSMLILCIILCGCTSKGKAEVYINLSTSVEEYHLVMSSVPGLPLILKTNTQSSDSLSYKIEVTAGELIEWSSQDGTITELGDKMTSPYKDCTIYWRPNTNDATNSSDESELIIEVLDNKTDEILEADNYTIVKEDGTYRLTEIALTNK